MNKRISTIRFSIYFGISSIILSALFTLIIMIFTDNYWYLTLPWSCGPFLSYLIFRKVESVHNSLPFISKKLIDIKVILWIFIPIIYISIPIFITNIFFNNSINQNIAIEYVKSIDFLLTVVIICIGVAFEEFIWRGYFFPRINKIGLVKSSLLIGFIWAVWHFPAIITGDFLVSEPLVVGIIAFTLSLIGLSVIYNFLATKYSSWFLPWLLHVIHNIVHKVYTHAIPNFPTSSSILSSESGLLDAFFIFIIAIIMLIIYKKTERDNNAI